MVTTLAQTPGMWLRAGGAGMFSKSCKKALIKCGINPDDFGTFDQRADAQGGARKDFREEHCAQLAKAGKKHPPPCKFSGATSSCTCFESAEALDSEGAQDWIYLNSQSGHLSQNCFYQAPGKRADPCSNIRPSVGPDGKQNSGGYGYRDNDALCMDHIGLRVGQEHYWICRGEQAHRESLGEDQPVSEAEMERGVENSARIVVDRANSARGKAPDVDDDLKIEGGGTVADRAPEGAAVDKARSELSQDLQGKDGAKGKAGKAAAQGQKKPNSPAAGGASEKDKNKAVECIKDAWKKSLRAMQASAVAEHSTATDLEAAEVAAHNANPKNSPKVNSISEMPPAQRKAARGRVDDGVRKKQQELADLGAESKGSKGARGARPTAQDCLEYQANWLYLNQGRDSGGNPTGTFPPMQGNTGSGPPPATTPKKDNKKGRGSA